MISWKLPELSMESPNPGVSTTVSLSLTPLSSISTVDASSCMVFLLILSAAEGITRSGYKSVKNRLLIKVDLPSPDSPKTYK